MRKQAFVLLALVTVVLLGLPAGAGAQETEEGDPPVLALSFYMCDFGGGAGDRIEDQLEREIPVWKALVDEGSIMEHGYFFHWWADEWNLGNYTIGESIQAIVDANAEAGERLEAQFGDEPTAISQACPHHRDGFYTLGPSTAQLAEGAAGGN